MSDTVLTGWYADAAISKILKANSTGAEQSTHTLKEGDIVFCDSRTDVQGRYRIRVVNGLVVDINYGWAPYSFLSNIQDGTFLISDPGGGTTPSGAPARVVVEQPDGSVWEATQFTQLS